MKVILAGYSKTGTKSMVAALKQLDYNVYDVLEHYTEHGDDWKKILTKGGTTEDFKRMYENVDAVVDAPAFMFWDEIHKAFPEAKIILTMRDNEDDWYKSLWTQFEEYLRNPKLKILTLSPSHWRLLWFQEQFFPFMLGYYFKTSMFAPTKLNEMLTKMKYRRHNACVMQNAPKDKLLVFNVKQGWKPLCDFLGVEVPNTPFPYENVGGNVAKIILIHPLFVRMQREVKFATCLIFLSLAFGGYKLAKSTWPSTALTFFRSLIPKST